MVLCAGWALGAIWFAFVQSRPAPNAYFSYPKQLAKCREQPTSEARYNCTSRLMLAEDNAAFNNVLLIVLPPLVVLVTYFGTIRAIATHHDRIKSRHALAASRQRMEEWRRHLRDIKSGTATRHTEEIFPHSAEPPSRTPPPRARKR